MAGNEQQRTPLQRLLKQEEAKRQLGRKPTKEEIADLERAADEQRVKFHLNLSKPKKKKTK